MKENGKRIIIWVCRTLILLAYALSVYHFRTVPAIYIRRIELLTLFFGFLFLHTVFGFRRLYAWIFRRRAALAAAIFIFSVANNFNNSSYYCWNAVIQPDITEEDAGPVFGTPRVIRSDEWAVTLPRMASASRSDYGPVNELAMGGGQNNIAVAGLERDYAALARPALWGYYFLDFSHGLSFQWSYTYIFGFLFAFELCYILTKKKALGLLGGSLLWFSSFNAWWSFPVPFLSFCALPVLFYYMLTAGDWKRRFAFGLMLAIGGADFVVFLYPAWQVPIGWIVLTLMAYFLYEYRDWKDYRMADWLSLAAAFGFMVSIILRYLYLDLPYIRAISSTAYPGTRADTGGYSLSKLGGYALMLFAGFDRDGSLVTNECESAAFALGFPLAYVLLPLAIWISFEGRGTGAFVGGRKKALQGAAGVAFSEEVAGRRRLLFFLLFPLALLTLYCTCGLPAFLAKVTLLDHSMGRRTVDILGALLVLILIISLSVLRDFGGLRFPVALPLAVLAAIPVILEGRAMQTGFSLPVAELAAAFCAILLFFLLVSFRRTSWKTAAVVCAYVLAIGPLTVSPVMAGTAALTEKPFAKEVQQISAEEPDAIWIGTSELRSNYLIANGAKTLNSVNFMPNRDVWEKLDPDGNDEEIWNRYAHIEIHLTEAPGYSLELKLPDLLSLSIGPDVLDTLDVRYVFTEGPVEEAAYAGKLSLIYDEDGTYVYRVAGQE